MNTRLIYKEYKDLRFKFWLSFAILIATALIIPITFGYLADLFVDLLGDQALLHDLFIQFTNYPLYLFGNWYAKNLYQMGTLIALFFGMGLIANETTRKTSSLIFTQPLKRSTIYLYKFGTAAGLLILMLLFSTLILYPTTAMVGEQMPGLDFLAPLPMTAAGLLIILALTGLFSVLFDDSIKAGAISALILAIIAIPGWIPKEPIYKLSIFYHMKGISIFLNGEFPWLVFFIFLAITALLLIITTKILDQKDF